MMDDPSATQSPAEVLDYYSIGATYGGTLEFTMSVIEKAAHKSRIALRDSYAFGGSGFYVDGRNCRQGRLVRPTPEIEAWIKLHPHG
jgi:hypothetical protein